MLNIEKKISKKTRKKEKTRAKDQELSKQGIEAAYRVSKLSLSSSPK